MGLFDFLKSTPSANAISGQVRKAKELYAQPDYRRMAMDKLLKWDTDESLKGLLERFTVVVQSPHWDEEEKKWLVDEIIQKGERMIPLLRNFLFEKNEVNHAIVALKKLVSDPKSYTELLVQALQKRPPGDHRSVQAKREIIAALGDLSDRSLDPILLPYIDDHSDDVQCLVIELLGDSSEEKIIKKLLNTLNNEEHSARVARMSAKVLCDKKVLIEDDIDLSDEVKEEFTIKNKQLVRIEH
ncbi:MAG: HEAT repeat domain-containing protein [Myxococcales bacterium]|nr:HEAT repeat domain-containing protein [Myxococcales bacterium]USN51823.1 MAG: HEAT repeat domain-containing protein [Myxococcales bacterium]